jgi:hypothetical protein
MVGRTYFRHRRAHDVRRDAEHAERAMAVKVDVLGVICCG